MFPRREQCEASGWEQSPRVNPRFKSTSASLLFTRDIAKFAHSRRSPFRPQLSPKFQADRDQKSAARVFSKTGEVSSVVNASEIFPNGAAWMTRPRPRSPWSQRLKSPRSAADSGIHDRACSPKSRSDAVGSPRSRSDAVGSPRSRSDAVGSRAVPRDVYKDWRQCERGLDKQDESHMQFPIPSTYQDPFTPWTPSWAIETRTRTLPFQNRPHGRLPMLYRQRPPQDYPPLERSTQEAPFSRITDVWGHFSGKSSQAPGNFVGSEEVLDSRQKAERRRFSEGAEYLGRQKAFSHASFTGSVCDVPSRKLGGSISEQKLGSFFGTFGDNAEQRLGGSFGTFGDNAEQKLGGGGLGAFGDNAEQKLGSDGFGTFGDNAEQRLGSDGFGTFSNNAELNLDRSGFATFGDNTEQQQCSGFFGDNALQNDDALPMFEHSASVATQREIAAEYDAIEATRIEAQNMVKQEMDIGSFFEQLESADFFGPDLGLSNDIKVEEHFGAFLGTDEAQENAPEKKSRQQKDKIVSSDNFSSFVDVGFEDAGQTFGEWPSETDAGQTFGEWPSETDAGQTFGEWPSDVPEQCEMGAFNVQNAFGPSQDAALEDGAEAVQNMKKTLFCEEERSTVEHRSGADYVSVRSMSMKSMLDLVGMGIYKMEDVSTVRGSIARADSIAPDEGHFAYADVRSPIDARAASEIDVPSPIRADFDLESTGDAALDDAAEFAPGESAIPALLPIDVLSPEQELQIREIDAVNQRLKHAMAKIDCVELTFVNLLQQLTKPLESKMTEMV